MDLSSQHFRLGAWFVDPGLNRVTQGDETLRLEPRAMEVLVYLANQAGKLVSKQELIDNVWRAEVVAQGSLTAIISQLRSALHDTPSHPAYIETIHTKGYRLVAEVQPLPPRRAAAETRVEHNRPSVFPRQERPDTTHHRRIEETKGATEAEAGLLHAIEIAKESGDRYQELRAAARLAGLWKNQDRITEALELLQPIVDGFSAEIDTVPLLEAKALLWDLTEQHD